MKTFNSLKKNLNKDNSTLPEIKIALIGDSATQLLSQAICGYGIEKSVSFNMFEGGYNQIDQLVLNTHSELYHHQPEVIIIYHSYSELKDNFYKLNQKDKLQFAYNHINRLKLHHRLLSVNSSVKIVYLNLPEINDGVFGSFALQTEASLLHQIREINSQMISLTKSLSSFYLADINGLFLQYGYNKAFSSKLNITSGITLSIDILPPVSLMITNLILALKGQIKKCVILDLDNTLWGGIIGDDGIENIELGNLGRGKAFVQFQLWLKQLKERGIILCICSKNEEVIAKVVFEKHPDMVLQLDDFALFVANWNNKAENIQHIRKTLNIGYDSMVFIDDSAFEREIVKSSIPDVCVPEMPIDPALYLEYLQSLNLFDTVSYTVNDKMRTKQYQEEAMRNKDKAKHFDEDDFLRNLDMNATVHVVQSDNTYLIPRISQLCQRTNQFNLKTSRFTEDNIRSFTDMDDYIVFAFDLQDKYGNNGLVSSVIIKKEGKSASIVNWVMSCRVFNRGLEHFIINYIVSNLMHLGVEKLIGEYIPTAKNKFVSSLFKDFGFSKQNEIWLLQIDRFNKFKNFITNKNG